MPDLDASDLKALRARLDELGPEGVAALLASDSFPPGHRLAVARWLAEQASAPSAPAPRRAPGRGR